MKVLNVFIIVAMAAMMISCQNQEKTKQNKTQISTALPVQKMTNFQKGDRVPNNEVCMVNDAYMGKKQIEIPFEGKTYYGCCAMCVERIPKDGEVRMAIDPFTGQKIDKANAYIILLSKEGDVAYFESEENYRNFIDKQN